MPVVTALENSGMSTSEEGLPINGTTLGGQAETAPLDEVTLIFHDNSICDWEPRNRVCMVMSRL